MSYWIRIWGTGFALALMTLAGTALPAAAAEFPYTLDEQLSLTGDCSTTTGVDEVPDPDCPYPAPPAGPSGRFNEPRSIAIDAYGNEYVASYGGASGGRIDVFDDEGRFITELADPFGPKSLAVDSKGNLYVLDSSELTYAELVRYTPTVYNPEQGEIAYGNPRVVLTTHEASPLGGVAVDFSTDRLYVSWWDTYISEYGSASEGNVLLDEITHPDLFSNQWVAVDGERDRIYASSCRQGISDCVVLVFDLKAPYELLGEIDGSSTPGKDFLSSSGRLALAVDETNGHFFVGDLTASRSIYEFDENFDYVSKTTIPSSQSNPVQIAVSNSPLNEDAKNRRYLFVPLQNVSGNALAYKPPKILPPTVEAATATNVGETEAELRGLIDPGTDPEGEPARYTIEYVTAAQFAIDGFANATLAKSGTIPSGTAPRQVSAFVNSLTPGAEYRFRVFAENGAGEDEAVGSFTTYVDAPPGGGCPNETLRTGFSAALPDCRAYELVTPADTNGNPTKGAYIQGDRFASVQSSSSGGSVSFQLLGGALPGSEATGGLYGDPYLAIRGPSGWSSVLVGPTGAQASKPQPGSFSPDQGHNFWLADGEGSAVINGGEAHYVRYPDGRSELIGRGSIATDPKAIGKLITEGGGHIVFETISALGPPAIKLEPNAPPTGTDVVYDRTADEVTHVVSLLPGNVTPAAGEDANYLNASADGEGIAFEIGDTLYLRKNNAVTYEIADNVEFAGVSEGGERIFYVEAGKLLAFDTATKTSVVFTPGVTDAVPVNVAPSGTRAYFVSEEVLGGANPNGDIAQANEQNLYLSTEGTIGFVATVTDRDVEGENSASGQFDGLGTWTTEALLERKLGFDPSRLTFDGSIFLFQSRANLDGFDPGGEPQVYRYDGTADRLHCLSCPSTKATASGGAALQSFIATGNTDAPFGPHGFVPNLAAGGDRVFFESTEALVSTDTDTLRDVYEWEEQGIGSCARPGGCVYLISSGHSAANDYLFGHSQSGDDVFFTTNDVLVGGDQTTLSVYDAKVGGGFPEVSREPCEGEGCRPALSPPAPLIRPAVPAMGVSDNVVRSCPKGKRKVKRKGKVVCVKKKKHRKHKQRKAAGKGARR